MAVRRRAADAVAAGRGAEQAEHATAAAAAAVAATGAADGVRSGVRGSVAAGLGHDQLGVGVVETPLRVQQSDEDGHGEQLARVVLW